MDFAECDQQISQYLMERARADHATGVQKRIHMGAYPWPNDVKQYGGQLHTKHCSGCGSCAYKITESVFMEGGDKITVAAFECGDCQLKVETRFLTRMDDINEMVKELRRRVDNFKL